MTQGSSQLSITGLGWSLSLFLVISYVLCVIGGLLIPSMQMWQAWAPWIPGFEWLTLTSFLYGLAGSFVYGWYIAVVFGLIYNRFAT